MEELRFDGKTAIVTGAGGNPSLGRVYALLLAARGANVVVNDIGSKHAPGAATAQGVVDEIVALGGKAVADTNSVATEKGANAIIQTALDTFGGVDILVNNAGIIFNVAFDEISSADIQRTMDVNLMGPIWASRAAWPHMKKKGYGRIVNLASIAGKEGNPTASAYSASKAAVIGFTKALGKELARTGVTANVIAPATVETPVLKQVAQTHIDYMLSKIPMGRFGKVEEVTAMIVWLASEECSYATGAVFDASGGRATY
jgi:NAD(P)-dependent dehydrogenase (short-subunit alcohol dehydrogenase family)